MGLGSDIKKVGREWDKGTRNIGRWVDDNKEKIALASGALLLGGAGAGLLGAGAGAGAAGAAGAGAAGAAGAGAAGAAGAGGFGGLGLGLGGAALGLGSSLYGGKKQVEAAKESAAAQLQAGREGMELTRESRDLARGDLAPFRTFGEGVLPQLQTMLTPEGQAAYANENNPIFKAALDNMNRRTAINAAITGRTGAGDTNQQYLQNWQAAAMPLIQNQQNMLFNAANIGQSSAAGQANTALTTGANLSNLRTDMGAAQAGGIVGAANAKAGMYQDAVRGLTSYVNPNATGWSNLFTMPGKV